MKNVITIGAALIDIFVYADAFQVTHTAEGEFLCQKYGDKVELDRLEMHTGGGGGNTAAGFSRLGFSSSVVCETGKDMWAQVVLAELEKDGVNTSFISKEKKEQTGGSVILTGKDGGRTVMVHRGAAAMLDPGDIPTTTLSQADWVHLSSIAGNLSTLKAVFGAVSEQRQLSWNPGQLELKLLESGQLQVQDISAKIMFLNQEEWELVSQLQSALLQQIPIIVVTNGKQGGRVFENGTEAVSYQILEVPTLQETGAGDAFATAFVAGYLNGYSLSECSDFGRRNAAAVVQQVGAKSGLLKKEDLFSL